MSSRPGFGPNTEKPLIKSKSMATSFNGPASIILEIPGISYDISWTGTPVGAFTVQVSNTYVQGSDGSVKTQGNWFELPSDSFTGSLPIPSGSSGTGFIDVVGTEAYAVRLVYTATSGDGTCTVVPCSKVL